jgi:hypothetical protein
MSNCDSDGEGIDSGGDGGNNGETKMKESTMSDYEAEVIKAEYSEGAEWEFRADVRIRLHNPEGDDVIVRRTYQARPKFDGVTGKEDQVHEYAGYWWPEAKEQEGDGVFFDHRIEWTPSADLNDDESLLEECVYSATFDPQEEVKCLKENCSERFGERLSGAGNGGD